jgi:hypothetical protein
MSLTLRFALVDAFSSEKEPHDGHFYAKIRHYQCIGDDYLEDTWWARLASISIQKKKNLARLLRSQEYRSAFDCQIDMPGLRGGMKLGTIHKMLSMRCDEVSDIHWIRSLNGIMTGQECLRYLNYVSHIWSTILSQDTAAMQKLDVSTVNEVELTAPGYCEQDAFHLKRKLQRGEIFGAFSTSERERIWMNMLSVSTDRLIPSLRAFFDDVNYLQGPADCLKRLISATRGGWISKTLRREFTGVNQKPDSYIVQTSETEFEDRPGNSSDQVEFGIRHMWIRAMRDHHEIPAQRKKVAEDRLASSEPKEDETIFCAFGSFAYRLGFETKKIHEVLQRSSDREIARTALLKARKPERYVYDTAEFELYVDKIVSFFNAASAVSKMPSYKPGTGFPNRCGQPKELDHAEDRKVLFMDNLHRPIQGGCGVTSFFVRRSVYLAFFDYPSERPDGRRNGQDLDPDQEMTMQHVGATEQGDSHVEDMLYSKEMITEQARQEDHNSPTAIPRGVDTMIQNRPMQYKETVRSAQEVEKQAQKEAAELVQRDEGRAPPTTSKRGSRSPVVLVDVQATRTKTYGVLDVIQLGDDTTAAGAGTEQVEQDADQHVQQAEADAAQRIQRGQADAAAATAAAEAEHVQQATIAAVANEAKRIQQAEEQRLVEAEARSLWQKQSTEGLIRAKKKKGTMIALDSGEQANRVQIGASEQTANHIQETRTGPLEESKRSASKTLVTRTSADESESYETAKEEEEDIARNTVVNLPGEDKSQTSQRERAPQDPHKTVHQVLVEGTAKEERTGSSPFLDQNHEQLNIQKRSTRIQLEHDDILGKVMDPEMKATETGPLGSIVPQKRKRRSIHPAEEIELMVEANGRWVVESRLTESSHHKWFQKYGLNWDLWDSTGKQLIQETCFEDVLQDGTHKIYLTPRNARPSRKPGRVRLGTNSIVRSNVAFDAKFLQSLDWNIDGILKEQLADSSLDVQTKDTLSLDSDSF